MPFPTLLSVNDWKRKAKDQPDAKVETLLRKIHAAKTIYDRLDLLIDLLHYAETHPTKPHYSELSADILQVLGYILDEQNIDSLRKKITAREKIREYDPSYIPWPRPDLEVANDPLLFYEEIKDRGEQEKKDNFNKYYEKIKYQGGLLHLGGEDDPYSGRLSNLDYKSFEQEELETFRVFPHNTKLITFDAQKSGDDRRLTFKYFDTSQLSIKAYESLLAQEYDVEQTGIYTVHFNGSIYVGQGRAPQRTGYIFERDILLHPSYSLDPFWGLSPFMAGQVKSHNGNTTSIDAASGHFQPNDKQTTRAINFFKKIGIVNNLTRLPYFRPEQGSRVYTVEKHTEFTSFFRDHAEKNKLDFRIIGADYLKKDYPEGYAHYMWQGTINQELETWLKDSTVWSTPSTATIALTEAVEMYSKFGDYNNINKTLELLEKVSDAIEKWHKHHEETQSTSKRKPAVDRLETRILKQMIQYKILQLFRLVEKSSLELPPILKVKIDNFVDYKLEFGLFIEELKDIERYEKKSSFYNTDLIPKSLHKIIKLAVDSEKNDLKSLREINEKLTFELQKPEVTSKPLF